MAKSWKSGPTCPALPYLELPYPQQSYMAFALSYLKELPSSLPDTGEFWKAYKYQIVSDNEYQSGYPCFAKITKQGTNLAPFYLSHAHYISRKIMSHLSRIFERN